MQLSWTPNPIYRGRLTCSIYLCWSQIYRLCLSRLTAFSVTDKTKSPFWTNTCTNAKLTSPPVAVGPFLLTALERVPSWTDQCIVFVAELLRYYHSLVIFKYMTHLDILLLLFNLEFLNMFNTLKRTTHCSGAR